jgi:hypothetical protein
VVVARFVHVDDGVQIRVERAQPGVGEQLGIVGAAGATGVEEHP